MDILTAMNQRHSVRSFKNQKIDAEILDALQAEIVACNSEGGLNIQLVTNEPHAFDGILAHYGKFSGVQNYIALIGEKSDDLDQKIGYYGERLVLKAQALGLNSCWVAMTVSKGVVKKNCNINDNEKLGVVIAIGYGETQGVAHNSKSLSDVASADGNMPEWFKNGVEAALLAPTAMNQQKFYFELNGSTVTAKSLGGFYSKVDLGIVKYHFELGAGTDNFKWA